MKYAPNGSNSAVLVPEHADLEMIHGQHGIVAGMTAAVHLSRTL